MRDEQGRITVDGFADEVEPLGPAERDALERLPVDVDAVKAELGLAELDAPAGGASPSGWPPGRP